MDKTKYGSAKYIGMDIHKETISIAVMNAVRKFVMECVIETKTNTVLQLIHGLRGDLQVTFEEGQKHRRGYWRRGGILKTTKTEASAKPVPMHPALKQALRSGGRKALGQRTRISCFRLDYIAVKGHSILGQF